MKRKIVIIAALIISVLLLLSSCSSKYDLSGTYYSDDLEGNIYSVYASGKIETDGLTVMSYEHLSKDQYILHLDKVDALATYSKEFDTITYKYEGFDVHWYSDPSKAEKSRSKKFEQYLEAEQDLTSDQVEPKLEEQPKEETPEETPAEENKEATSDQVEPKLEEVDEKTAASDESLKKSLIGTWSTESKDIKIVFDEKNYSRTTIGKDKKEATQQYTYSISNGKIILNTAKNKTEEISPSLSKDGKTLTLTLSNKEKLVLIKG